MYKKILFAGLSLFIIIFILIIFQISQGNLKKSNNELDLKPIDLNEWFMHIPDRCFYLKGEKTYLKEECTKEFNIKEKNLNANTCLMREDSEIILNIKCLSEKNKSNLISEFNNYKSVSKLYV